MVYHFCHPYFKSIHKTADRKCENFLKTIMNANDFTKYTTYLLN